jgi:hypothetical protein
MNKEKGKYLSFPNTQQHKLYQLLIPKYMPNNRDNLLGIDYDPVIGVVLRLNITSLLVSVIELERVDRPLQVSRALALHKDRVMAIE